MLCLNVRNAARIAAELRERGIDVDTRPGTGIRLSAHPCNTLEDCALVLAELAALPRADLN